MIFIFAALLLVCSVLGHFYADAGGATMEDIANGTALEAGDFLSALKAFDGVGVLSDIANDELYAELLKETFAEDIATGLLEVLPVIFFLLTALTAALALIGFIVKKYPRLLHLILALGLLAVSVCILFSPLLGADGAGFDGIGATDNCQAAYGFLDRLEQEGRVPRMILYSLNPGDNAWIDVLLGAFQSAECPGKLQHGSAWWFNDHYAGIREHLTSLANLSVLGNFIGMLTDSRSLLSYVRHGYFRRILCGLLGEWVEQGKYPEDMETLGELVQDICFRNARRYFNL